MPNNDTASWFIHIQGETIGPLSGAALGSLLRCARLMPTDLLWREGMKAWERVADLPLAKFPAASSPVPAGLPALPPSPQPMTVSDRAVAEAVEIRDARSGESAPREQRRYWVLRMARVRLDGMARIDGHGLFPVHDLSESGVFLVTRTPIAVGTPLSFRLEAGDLPQPLALTGMVARVGLSEGGQHGFAVRFESLAASERHRLQELVRAKHVRQRNS